MGKACKTWKVQRVVWISSQEVHHQNGRRRGQTASGSRGMQPESLMPVGPSRSLPLAVARYYKGLARLAVSTVSVVVGAEQHGKTWDLHSCPVCPLHIRYVTNIRCQVFREILE